MIKQDEKHITSLIRVLLPCIIISMGGGCIREQGQAVKAPPNMRLNEAGTVALVGVLHADDRFVWTAVGGRFEGPIDRPSVTFVPTSSGHVTVICNIKSADNKIVARDATIDVSGAETETVKLSPSDSPQASTAGSEAKPFNIDDAGYIPSGFMGDGAKGDFVKLDPNSGERPHSPPACYKIGYRPGPVRWAAIAWQYPENNWGDSPGRDLGGRGFREVSVWARALRGRNGVLPKVQFKAGGNSDPAKPIRASFAVAGDFVTLTEDWERYTLDISGKDLKSVISAFTVVIRAQDVGPAGATFYLDDIEYR